MVRVRSQRALRGDALATAAAPSRSASAGSTTAIQVQSGPGMVTAATDATSDPIAHPSEIPRRASVTAPVASGALLDASAVTFEAACDTESGSNMVGAGIRGVLEISEIVLCCSRTSVFCSPTTPG